MLLHRMLGKGRDKVRLVILGGHHKGGLRLRFSGHSGVQHSDNTHPIGSHQFLLADIANGKQRHAVRLNLSLHLAHIFHGDDAYTPILAGGGDIRAVNRKVGARSGLLATLEAVQTSRSGRTLHLILLHGSMDVKHAEMTLFGIKIDIYLAEFMIAGTCN